MAHAHSRAERRTLSAAIRRPWAAVRHCVEAIIGELTDLDWLQLAWHGARTVWGLPIRTAATILVPTLLRLEIV